MSGIADTAISVWGGLKDGRRPGPLAAEEPKLRTVKKKKITRPPPEPDANARLLLALREELNHGLPLREAVNAANKKCFA